VFLSEAFSEVGEEAEAGGVLIESACSCGSCIVFEMKGESTVAGDSEEVFEELGFEDCQRVVGFSPWAFLVVEAFEEVVCVRGVDRVEHLFYLHCFFNL